MVVTSSKKLLVLEQFSAFSVVNELFNIIMHMYWRHLSTTPFDPELLWRSIIIIQFTFLMVEWKDIHLILFIFFFFFIYLRDMSTYTIFLFVSVLLHGLTTSFLRKILLVQYFYDWIHEVKSPGAYRCYSYVQF